ncbi:hypothetical protein B0H12DRAFT_1300352 [Mycena haematopus]|nr:hypothetical protein B0H12DRAFT_1300352 [Mycena haematopus]
MPRQPTVTETRLENIIACLTPAVTVLNDLNSAFAPPFIQPISNTVSSLIKLVQSVKQNKKECAQLMENIHQVLTLHKIYIYIEAQQDRNKLTQLFRNNEMNKVLKDCRVRLDQALQTFEINTGLAMFHDISEINKEAKITYKNLLELISTMSETTTVSDKSSVYVGTNELKNSSNSFSLLPSKPKIFYGRETEVEAIIKILGQQAPRIAILGGGGMGKTSLARAVLHHSDTLTRFEERFFVSVESATTSVELAALVGLHVGLNPSKDLTKAIVQYFARRSSCLLILDNLETVWEPVESRTGVEEFLALLTEIEHLGLIITMRGAERPSKVQWSHPFLLPLQSLSDDAAQQTFMDITDNFYAIKDLNQLLSFTGNMPLAVDLISHLVDYEGLENVLARWETEKTSMLSVGYDRKSNVDASIQLSLSSPRITSESKELLSLLSILPNGLSDAELVQSKLPIANILSCKATLLATSLAYQNSNKRLLALVPVREHIQQFLPPSPSLIHSLRRHFYALLQLFQKHQEEQMGSVVNQITLNLANLQEVFISLNSFYRLSGRGVLPLMYHIQHILSGTSDHQLEIHFLIECLRSYGHYQPTFLLEESIVQGMAYFEQVNDPLLKFWLIASMLAKFYDAASWFFYNKSDLPSALKFIQSAQNLAMLSGDSTQQSSALIQIAQFKLCTGDYSTAYMHAREAQQLSELSMNLYHNAQALHIQAICSRYLGNYQKSVLQLYRAREILKICDYNALPFAFSLLNIAYIDIQISDTAESVRKNLNTAMEIFTNFGHIGGIIACKISGADMDLREHMFDLAQVKFRECLHHSWGIDNEGESLCLERLANIKAWPAIELQWRWPVIYLGWAYKVKEKLALYKALLFLGDVFMLNNNDEHTAFNLYTIALEGFTFMDVHQSRAECMLRLGDIAHSQRNTSEAIDHWKMAQLLFQRSSQAKDVDQIDSKLAALEKVQEEALVKLATLQAPTQLLEELFITHEEPVKTALV